MQLDKLQSNILKSHNRKHVVLLPLQFEVPANQLELRGWIASFSRQHVTSASQQHEEIARFRQTRQDAGSVLGNFYISPFGYKKLHLDPDQLEPESISDPPVSFAHGMAIYEKVLNDPPQDKWEESYQKPIDAMILLAANDAGRLLAKCAKVLFELRGVAEPLAMEVGKTLFNASGQRIEHFGFVDGISDPQFTEVDPGGGARQQWDPRADVSLVLTQDKLAPKDEPDCLGSFLVYRKLEQNVKRFKELVRDLAQHLTNGDEMFARAMVVGRFPNGSPLVLSARGDHPGVNDFDYRDDRDGSRCPFHSHIRKMTPRGGSDRPLKEERTHRIARRGITYGQRSPRLDDEPETGVGTLFLCFQSSIPKQFAFLQKKWANRPEFPRQGVGVDPLANQVATVTPQQWPTVWDQSEKVEFDFSKVVTLKGGEFFFAPSLPFLWNLNLTAGT